MANDPTSALNEIADLLRERVALAKRSQEYQEEVHRESQERLNEFKFQMPKFEMPEFPKLDRESMKERMERSEARTERVAEERKAFQERLLAEFERHNAALERILDRLTR